MTETQDRLGFVLSAGGARAAYQVGVLRYLGKHFPKTAPDIITGVSAGSINAAFLAQGDCFAHSTERMYELWRALRFEHVLKTNFNTVFGVVKNLAYDLLLSKMTRKVKFTSVLDATPLAQTLRQHINFSRISKNVRDGSLLGFGVTTTDYRDGSHKVFYESHHDIAPWRRHHRYSENTQVRLKHVIASCSIPILFEAVRIGDSYFGDGAIGFGFPFSPSIHLGANRIFAVGLSSIKKEEAPTAQDLEIPSLGYIAGSVLNSIFVDSLAPDFENICKMNELAKTTSSIKHLEVLLIRPSEDLGKIAQSFLKEIPFHLRQLLNATAASPVELGTLISYVMFTPGYLSALIALGEKDAQAKHEQMKEFFLSKR